MLIDSNKPFSIACPKLNDSDKEGFYKNAFSSLIAKEINELLR
jgi:hypothetical protein